MSPVEDDRVRDWQEASVSYSARILTATSLFRRRRGHRVLIVRHFGSWRCDLASCEWERSGWLPDLDAARAWTDRRLHELSEPPGAPLEDPR